jgi:uncharacterized RDD family membrane protein YckC
MSSSAQLDPVAAQGLFIESTVSAADLKRFAAERLAAHRRRQAPEVSAQDVALLAHASAALDARVPGASRVREAVAARYRQSVSYQEFLAAQAAQTMQQARVEAEIADRNAQAVEAAQTELLEDLRQWREAAPDPESPALRLIQRLQEEIETHPVVVQAEVQTVPAPAIADTVAVAPAASAHWLDAEEQDELSTLDQEIAFRLDPEFDEHHIQPLPLPANLLEFPRQLVAPRKARPRLAEGPLREDVETGSQLRIFEVDPEQIATAPMQIEAETFADVPQWQSQPLDAGTYTHHEEVFDTDLDADLDAAPERAPYDPAQSAIYTQPVLNAPLHTAAIRRRVLSAAVDGCCLSAAAIGFTCLAVVVAGPSLLAMPRPLLGALVSACVLALYVVYHLLFFTFADATPGMRYAHLDFCTFSNENPTRAALRRRIWTTLAAALPLGLGLLWMVVDYDHAGWHDRMSKMYPREY